MDHVSRFAGIDRLYGRGAVARLQNQHVAVIGVGLAIVAVTSLTQPVERATLLIGLPAPVR